VINDTAVGRHHGSGLQPSSCRAAVQPQTGGYVGACHQGRTLRQRLVLQSRTTVRCLLLAWLCPKGPAGADLVAPVVGSKSQNLKTCVKRWNGRLARCSTEGRNAGLLALWTSDGPGARPTKAHLTHVLRFLLAPNRGRDARATFFDRARYDSRRPDAAWQRSVHDGIAYSPRNVPGLQADRSSQNFCP